MITESLSLALCTVMFRRFMDSFTGRIPAVVQSSTAPNTTALFMFSGALYYLYNHLRKGTLVRIGQGRPRQANRSVSRLAIQRRSKNNSWFLRNARACRKRCTDAMYKIAKQSFESLHSINPCVLLPNKSFHISFSKARESSPSEQESRRDQNRNFCDVIYSNNSFGQKDKEDDNNTEEVKIVQTPLKQADESPRSAGKRGTKSYIKRLCEENVKVDNEVNVSSRYSAGQKGRKGHKKFKRTTRSGRVYALID